MKISIIVPVFNEEKTIATLLQKVLEKTNGWEREIIVVNDGSSDQTINYIQPFLSSIVLINLEKNKGKGFAVREGIKHSSGEAIIIQDADLEYDPQDYSKLLTPIYEGKAKVVYGSRYLQKSNTYYSLWHYLANKIINSFFNFIFKTKLTDVMTCYKVFLKEVLQNINLKENRFGFELELTAQIVTNGFEIMEVPISYQGRSYKEGKKIGWKDGVLCFYLLTKYLIKKISHKK